jgi:glycosyltransferase involved in cell wall biosynthesis
MQTISPQKLVMLGAAPETRGSIAAAVGIWREQGLFRRWPIEYIATHCDATALQNAKALLKGLRRFAEILGRHRRLAVHAHVSARAGLWRESAFLGVAAAARSPLVLQLHGGGFERFHDAAATPVRAAIRYFLEGAACVIVPSESLRGWTRSVTRDANVVCLPPAVAFQNGISERAERQNLILFLGRLEAEKGVFDLLEAVASLRVRVPDIRLVCAGEGDRAGVARFAARLGIADAVKFTGWVGPSGKRALLESAAVFALPSYGEGLPLGLLEAMAAGVPVVASPVGGIPEVVADGTSGLLAAPGDKAALARHLAKLLLEPAAAARIGAAARETVRLRFAPERGLARLESLYADLGVRSNAEPGEPHEPRAPEQTMRHAA